MYLLKPNGKTKGSGPNSRHSQGLLYSYFLCKCISDFIKLISDIWTLPLFQIICYISLCCDIVLHCILFTRHEHILSFLSIYRISRPIRRTVIFSLEILEKNNDECILISVIYWKKTGLLHTKISNHNIIYWKKTGLLHTKISNHNIIYSS